MPLIRRRWCESSYIYLDFKWDKNLKYFILFLFFFSYPKKNVSERAEKTRWLRSETLDIVRIKSDTCSQMILIASMLLSPSRHRHHPFNINQIKWKNICVFILYAHHRISVNKIAYVWQLCSLSSIILLVDFLLYKIHIGLQGDYWSEIFRFDTFLHYIN